MTVQLEFLLVFYFFKYLNVALYINVWALIIQTFQSSKHTEVPVSLDKPGSTVYMYIYEYTVCLCVSTICIL